jgi:hypothetical protein
MPKSREIISRQDAGSRVEVVQRAEDLLANTMINLGYPELQPVSDQVGDYQHDQTTEFNPVDTVDPAVAHVRNILNRIDLRGSDD